MHMRSVRNSSRGLRRFLGCLSLLILGLAVAAGPTRAQDFPGAPAEPSLNLRVYPLDTWSPRVGVGVGAGLVGHHLGRRHAQGLLTVAPARHEQVATLAWASANPRRADRYTLVSARGLHTNRDWFYGLGPGSAEAAQQSIERSALRARVRVGQHFLGRRLLVQPHLGISAHRVDRVPAPSAPRLDARSRRHLQQLASERVGSLTPSQTHLRVGVDAEYDTRRPFIRPTRGLLLKAGWTRGIGLSSSFLTYDELTLEMNGYVPLGGAHHLVGQLSWARVVPRGRASVPYYLRPTLDGIRVPGWARHRFVDTDRLIGSVLYRFPLARPWNVVRLDGHAGVHVANVYDDVFSDATLDVTFADSPLSTSGTVPLRPAASVGLHVGLSFRQVPALDLALGMSPEGITGARFALKYDLQALRSPHHRIRR